MTTFIAVFTDGPLQGQQRQTADFQPTIRIPVTGPPYLAWVREGDARAVSYEVGVYEWFNKVLHGTHPEAYTVHYRYLGANNMTTEDRIQRITRKRPSFTPLRGHDIVAIDGASLLVLLEHAERLERDNRALREDLREAGSALRGEVTATVDGEVVIGLQVKDLQAGVEVAIPVRKAGRPHLLMLTAR